MSLVRDFLTSFNMQFTLAVFDPETCEGVSYKNMSRSNLAKELGLENVNPDVPLLHALVANSIKEQNPAVSGTNTEKKLTSTSIELIEAKLGNLKGIISTLNVKLSLHYVLCIYIYSTEK